MTIAFQRAVELQKDIESLKAAETFCAMQVCGGDYLTKSEVDKCWSLRAKVGLKYDAVNGKWLELDAGDIENLEGDGYTVVARKLNRKAA